MKELVEKSCMSKPYLPHKVIYLSYKSEIFQEACTNELSDFFTKIYPKLASEIPDSTQSFENCLSNAYPNRENEPLSFNELKDIYIYIFHLSFEKGVFTDTGR